MVPTFLLELFGEFNELRHIVLHVEDGDDVAFCHEHSYNSLIYKTKESEDTVDTLYISRMRI